MRVISLYQPYATLMALGLKTNETRSWDTKYRGALAIHATANMPAWCRELCYKEPFRSTLGLYGYNALNLPKGAIVGTVEVVGTADAKKWAFDACIKLHPRSPERERIMNEIAFGDYSEDRFAWQTINPVRFDTPIPATGSQGFWNFDFVSNQRTSHK